MSAATVCPTPMIETVDGSVPFPANLELLKAVDRYLDEDDEPPIAADGTPADDEDAERFDGLS